MTGGMTPRHSRSSGPADVRAPYSYRIASDRMAEITESVGQRMSADFRATALVQHRGGKGAARDEIVRKFIANVVPGSVSVTGRGEIISADDQVSPECDVMVVDLSTPPLTDQRDFRIVPAECVHAIVEVKSHLDGPELLDACDKIMVVKALRKAAFALTRSFLEMTDMYGRNYWYTPTAGLIFALDSIDLEELGRQLVAWCRDKDVAHVPDGAYILNKAHHLWSTHGGEWRARPDHESDLAVIHAYNQHGNLFPLAIPSGPRHAHGQDGSWRLDSRTGASSRRHCLASTRARPGTALDKVSRQVDAAQPKLYSTHLTAARFWGALRKTDQLGPLECGPGFSARGSSAMTPRDRVRLGCRLSQPTQYA
jgi:hypothetical protein